MPGLGPAGLNTTSVGVGPVAVLVAAGGPVWVLQFGPVAVAVAVAAAGTVIVF